MAHIQLSLAPITFGINVREFGNSIGAAISAAPAGGIVYIPAGTYNFTGLTITKPVVLQGESAVSTILNYTPSSSVAITENYGTSGFFAGLRDLTLQGPDPAISGASSATTGILLGGTSGAPWFHARNVYVTGFGTGVTFGNNAYLITFSNCLFGLNFVNMVYPSGLTNSGENVQFADGTHFSLTKEFYNSSFAAGFQVNGLAELSVVGASFDGCRIDIPSGAGPNIKLVNPHFEWPGGTRPHPFITCADAGAVMSMTGAYILSAANSGGVTAVSMSAGMLSSFGLQAYNYGTAITNVFTLSGTASLSLFGTVPLQSWSGFSSLVANSGTGTVVNM